MTRHAAVAFVLIVSSPAFSQTTSEPDEWKLERARGKQIVLGMLFEQPYIHTSKPFYYAGETVWFKAYMKYRTPRLSDSLSRVLYVDLIDDQQRVVSTKTLRINHGVANGSIVLPGDQSPGNYAIRAYTNWMRNYESSAVFVQALPVLGEYDLMDEQGLVSDINSNSDELDVVFDREDYFQRDKVGVDLNLVDDAGMPLKGDFSVSVTHAVYNPPISWRKDIRTQFSTPGEVKVVNNHALFRMEKGLTWVGKFNADKKRSHIDNITFIGRGFNEVRKVTPTRDGVVVLYNVDPPGDMSYEYMASRNSEVVTGRLEGLTSSVLPVETIQPVPSNVVKQASVQRISVLSGQSNLTVHSLDKSVASIVAASGNDIIADPPYWNEKSMNQYGSPFSVVTADDITRAGSNLADAIRMKVPGYQLSYRRDHWMFVNTRSGCSPTILEEGRQFVMIPGQTVGDWLMTVPTWNIERVDISSFSSSVYGSVNGSINVYYKQIQDEGPRTHSMVIGGYDQAAAFEGPAYIKDIEVPGDDLRTTLYWNPAISVGNDGKSSFSFCASDLPGMYRVVIEGLTEDGEPIHVEKRFRVSER